MRILQIFNRYDQFGGEEAAVLEIESALRTKHEVQTFFGSTREMMGVGLAGQLQAPFKAIWNDQAFGRLKAVQKRERFDIWMVHNVFPGLSPSVYDAAKSSRVPVIQYLHNYRFACINGFLLNHGEPCQRCLNGNFLPAVQTRCWQESRLACAAMAISITRLRAVGVFRRVAHWIAVSQAQKAIHVRIGIPEENISVIYHFFDGKFSPQPTEGSDVLFIGRLSPEKGVDRLVEAWLEFPVQRRRLVVVGDGPLRQKLQSRAAGRADIEFTGFLKGDELRAVRRRAALTVVPSIWEEAFGRVLIESWAHGIPVLAARIGALPELVEATDAGWLFDPKKPGDLINNLHALCDDPALLKKAAACCAAASVRFSRTHWFEQIETVLDTVRTNGLKGRKERPSAFLKGR
jgi:glycosyltransferase involved in cell wall biosynthesis